MSNYPPGVTGNDIDDLFGDEGEVEQAEDDLEITYRLVVETKDGEELYNEDFLSLSSLEESGLRKAEHAHQKAINERIDLSRYSHTDNEIGE